MAIDRWTTAQILQFRYCEPMIGLILETLAKYPELAFMEASPIPQTTYKILVQTELPSVGFRLDNKGRKVQRPKWEPRDVECKFIDASWDVDNKVADEHPWGREIFLQHHANSHFDAMFKKIAEQTWYGIVADTTGFIGIQSYLNNLTIPTVVNAKGTTANSATSVYAVSTGLQKAAYCWGQNGQIKDGPVHLAKTTDPDDPTSYFYAYSQMINGHVGLQVGTPKCIGRICNITEANPLNDDLMSDLFNSFETGFEPDAYFMTRKARAMLQKSRKAYSPFGTPVTLPDEFWGKPIYVTDALRNNEAIVA